MCECHGTSKGIVVQGKCGYEGLFATAGASMSLRHLLHQGVSTCVSLSGRAIFAGLQWGKWVKQPPRGLGLPQAYCTWFITVETVEGL